MNTHIFKDEKNSRINVEIDDRHTLLQCPAVDEYC